MDWEYIKDNIIFWSMYVLFFLGFEQCIKALDYANTEHTRTAKEVQLSKKEIKKIELIYDNHKDTIQLKLPDEIATYRLKKYNNGQPYLRICNSKNYGCKNYDNVIDYKILK